jgi:serine/threonine-protein kinase
VVSPIGDDTGFVRSAYDLSPGTQLGEYRIEAPLGGGGMGEVFAAVHPKIGKRAAVKVLKKELSNPFNVERFIDEAKVVNTIGHPNIVDIFAFGEMPDGRCYFVMELLIGQTLRERIARGPLQSSEVREILKPLTRALDAAHAKGVIHRDLKPDNIFLVDVPGEKPIVKLLDFGIAKLAKADHRVEQTKSGVMVGTPQYIAPEQAKGHAVDARADIYALGGITFEMLTGRPPFVADNAMEMVAKHLMEAPPKPSSIASGISQELDSLVVAMLAKDPAHRPTLADVALIVDRMKLGPIRLEDAQTSPYGGGARDQDHVTPPVRDTPLPRPGPVSQPPLPLRPPPLATPLPVAAVMTPAPAPPTSTFRGEPVSGAHTSVEPIITVPPIADHTERDAVTIPRSRGLWIGVSIGVLGVAMILSFVIVNLFKSSADDTAKADAQVDAQVGADHVTSEPIVAPDAGAPGTMIPDAAAVTVDAGSEPADVATVLPPDAGVKRPNPVVQSRPKPRLVLDIQGAGKVTTIKINGKTVGYGRHLERELILNRTVKVEVISSERKPKRFEVRATAQRPVVKVNLTLETDLMEPGK